VRAEERRSFKNAVIDAEDADQRKELKKDTKVTNKQRHIFLNVEIGILLSN